MTAKPRVTLPATVEKVIKPLFPKEPEKVQLEVQGADHLYRELRIENALTDRAGDKVRLREGAEVEITVEADSSATITRHDESAPENP
jgi:predicted DNA-binding antitoxin AbrB/MazE fold protein